MSTYNIVAATSEDTVVASYEPVQNRSDSYQSEAALEREFIHLLTQQGYEYLPIHKEADLIANLRRQLEALNAYPFTDGEWERFFSDAIANPNEHIVEKTRKIQEDFVQVLRRDDGSSKNISLIDKKKDQQGTGRPARQPLRCDSTGQRPAPGTYRAQAPGRGYPGGLQPDRPLSAGLLLGGVRVV